MRVQFSDFVYYTGTSTPVPRAMLTIYNFGTKNLASLYDVDGNTVDNPVETDESGLFSFYVELGTYDVWAYNKKQYGIKVSGSAVSSVNGETGDVTITASDLGLGPTDTVQFMNVKLKGSSGDWYLLYIDGNGNIGTELVP